MLIRIEKFFLFVKTRAVLHDTLSIINTLSRESTQPFFDPLRCTIRYEQELNISNYAAVQGLYMKGLCLIRVSTSPDFCKVNT